MPATRPTAARRPASAARSNNDEDLRTDDVDASEPAVSPGRRPARRAASSEDGPRRTPRPRDDDADARYEEEDKEPAPKIDIVGGWDTFKNNRAKSSGIPDTFKVEPDISYVVAFITNMPFANFRQHWIERTGKKSFICLDSDGSGDCPLCDMLGDEPKAMACFNIAVFEEIVVDGEKYIEPHVRVWEVGGGVGSELEKLDSDKVMGPLTKGYWRVSKARASTKGGSFKYSILPIKERDLDEDWGIAPLTDEEFAELETKSYTKDYLKISTPGELRTIAREES